MPDKYITLDNLSTFKGCLDTLLDDIMEVAEGKTRNYVISDATTGTDVVNTSFDSGNASITVTISGKKLVDVAGADVLISDLKVGDIVSVIETEVPDRWVGAIGSTSITLYKLETKLTVDTVVTQNSANPVTSGAVYTAINAGGGGGGIAELSTQYVRITDLDPGVYKLTYKGTKYLYYSGTTSTTTHTVVGSTGAVVLTVSKYSTSYWHWWYINGTTSWATLYYGYTSSSSGSTGSKELNSIYTGTPTDTKPQVLYGYNTDIKNTSGYSIYRYQLLVFNGTGLAAFTSTNNSTATTKTQLSPKYYPGSPIAFYKSITSVSNNGTIIGTSLYKFLYGIDLRYSFNVGTSTLTANSPVYLKMSVNSDGTLSPVYSASSGGHPLVQTLPNSADGYVYVYLGQTSSTSYNMDLDIVHPCYEYKNGAVREYIAESAGGGGGAVSSVNGATGAVSIGDTTGLNYLTTAPNSANASGLKIVVLSSEPSTKYSGYLYIITGGITFTVSSVNGNTTVSSSTYQAEDGMTWQQWVASAYNTDGFNVSGGYVYSLVGHQVSSSSGSGVSSSSVIVAGGNYSIFLTSGGGTAD